MRILLKLEDVFLYADCSGGPDACWPWLKQCNADGYGVFRIKHKNLMAHRVAWEKVNGPIPAGAVLRHLVCDNPPCINPAHLYLGSNAENSADMAQKGRAASGDRHGSRTHPESIPRGDRHGRYTKPERTARGERSGRAKLTNAAILEIRQAAANGETGASIARRLGINKSTACRVIRGENWQHVS